MVQYSSEASSKDIWIFGGFAYGLVLFLLSCVYTWSFFKNKRANDRNRFAIRCKCSQCNLKDDRIEMVARDPYFIVTRLGLLLGGWVFLVLIVLKIQTISSDDPNAPSVKDPFDVLEIVQGSSLNQIKKAYKRLLLKNHPDHGGDPEKFMDVSDAYKILTDESSREKWEKYGNLDGPTQLKYGIALPIWLLSDKTPPTIILLYYLCVLIGIPGSMYLLWKWCFPGKTEANVGEPIIGLFYRFFKETSLIPVKRLITILSACPIFDPDNLNRRSAHLCAFPMIKKLLTQMQMAKEMTRSVPFNSTYSIEARALLYAHLNRFSLEFSPFGSYQNKVLTTYRGVLGMILHEIVPLWRYIVYEAHLNSNFANINTHFCSRITTVENCIKFCGCIIQALQISDNNLLMLPHITNMDIARLQQRKRNVKGLLDFIKLPPKIRSVLYVELEPLHYDDIQFALKALPFVEMDVRARCDDDTQENKIVANSLFNVDVMFKRTSLHEVMLEKDQTEHRSHHVTWSLDEVNSTESKPLPKKANKKGAKKRKPIIKSSPAFPSDQTKETENQLQTPDGQNANSDTDDGSCEASNICWPSTILPINHKTHLKEASKIQPHCPLFEAAVCESWWIYISVNGGDSTYVPTLHRTECINDGYTCYIQTEAPSKPGLYTYTLNLISDVYHDIHYVKTFQVNVSPETPIDTKHHWSISSSGSDVDCSILTEEEGVEKELPVA